MGDPVHCLEVPPDPLGLALGGHAIRQLRTDDHELVA